MKKLHTFILAGKS